MRHRRTTSPSLTRKETNYMETFTNPTPPVDLDRLVRPHAFIAPRGWAKPDKEYRSRFNFVWWFWLLRIHTQRPDTMNPRVIRLIWLCFAVGLDIWGPESRVYWPNSQDRPSK